MLSSALFSVLCCPRHLQLVLGGRGLLAWTRYRGPSSTALLPAALASPFLGPVPTPTAPHQATSSACAPSPRVTTTPCSKLVAQAEREAPGVLPLSHGPPPSLAKSSLGHCHLCRGRDPALASGPFHTRPACFLYLPRPFTALIHPRRSSRSYLVIAQI